MNNTKRLASIESLLKDVPKFECRSGCADCCGPVIMTRLEMRRICERTGLKERDLDFMTVLQLEGSTCPLLDKATKKCTVYDIRPAICRVFGASDHPRLKCPHGCRPEKPWSTPKTDAVMDSVKELGHGLPANSWMLSGRSDLISPLHQTLPSAPSSPQSQVRDHSQAQASQAHSREAAQ